VHYVYRSKYRSMAKIISKQTTKIDRYLRKLYQLLKTIVMNPDVFARVIKTFPTVCSAVSFSSTFPDNIPKPEDSVNLPINPLWDYFENHKEGHGIWKFEHYFEIYHQHFAKFVGQKVNVLEIGVYSGGSLGMWRSYFGEKSHIYGVDIQEACKSYESENISVFIGDQADRTFWNNFRKSVEGIDVLIDDGGHSPDQQQITLEEMLPHLRPGGVYLCEDIWGDSNNRFTTFATTLVRELNAYHLTSVEPFYSFSVTRFQSSIHSIHFYPYIVVIEKHCVPPLRLSAPKRGTEWILFH
jgi:23S rRNA U2552 (ribose-2'-O)-methylase RlmE/FtsJ